MQLSLGKVRLLAIALLVFAMASAATATSAANKAVPPDPTEDPVLMTAGFLSAHPDLKYRLMGLDEYRKGNLDDALQFFRRSAFYGDKASQGMVAEMLWTAQGVAQDRPLAYAWMDLAAERGYEGFLGLRERYWAEMDERERERAIEVGQEVYAKYGDAAAEPRLAAVLRRERRSATGSRTGYTGALQIYVPGPGGYQQIDGSKMYDDRYWDPIQYRAWHDSIWMKPRIGKVDVGAVEQVRTDVPASRVPATAPQVEAAEPQTPEKDDKDLGSQPTP